MFSKQILAREVKFRGLMCYFKGGGGGGGGNYQTDGSEIKIKLNFNLSAHSKSSVLNYFLTF